MATPGPNPKDSMKSSWRTSDRSDWTESHYLLHALDVHGKDLNEPVPVHQKTDKVPFLSQWQQHRWVLFHSLLPIAVHQAIVSLTGHNLTAWQAFFFYSVAFKLIGIHEMHALRRLGHQLGFLDGDVHERDGVPDVGVRKTAISVMSTSTFRPMFTVFMTYSASQTPAQMNWLWLPFEIGLYGIILDFWFYWYHRLMHDVGALWKYHRTHHLTKHPNPLLALYADHEQEFFDIVGIPVATYLSMRLLGMPMGFYEWWICHQYIMFAEVAGHSGLRVWSLPPSTLAWALDLFDCGLIIEDHDMHHRKGWKSSGNYGKQTRLWDRIFGTCKDRVECLPGNVDFSKKVTMPLFEW
ncbi:hypothetical protein ANO11243_050860 [Dothideomycetidae sp. 11243]|nr:hypothetical protein ANO11243_050860 [fungal sp. No.11243]